MSNAEQLDPRQPPYLPADGSPIPGTPGESTPPKKRPLGLILGLVAAGVAVMCCGAAVLVAFAFAGGITRVSSPIGQGSGAGQPADSPAAKPASVGQPARDGKFEFTVTSVTCGKGRIGNDDQNETAQGQFCEVALSVKNIGKQRQTFDSGSQKALGTGGATYSVDRLAQFYLNGGTDALVNEINPGNVVKAVLVFDIPKDGKIASFELHDSPFSGGVTVTNG
jgi:hypothetical protein